MNSVTVTKPPERVWTAEKFARLSDSKSYELIEGTLRRRNMGSESSRIAMRLGMFLQTLLTGVEVFGPDAGYTCFSGSPDQVRKPDVTVVRISRLPGGKIPEGWLEVAPDLGVEVVSPSDRSKDIHRKVRDFLAAGTPVFWVIYPDTRTIEVHRAGSSTITLLEADGELTLEHLSPEFRVPVQTLFAPSA